MRLAIIGVVLLVAGAVAVATGTLPLADLAAMIDRVAPILLFVVAMTVVTELASEAGVFLWTARRLRHWGRGYSVLLWLFLAVFATLSTIFLSLDTTAVLLTPVVVSVTRQAGLPPLPFALTTVWLANTASLLLPISNLTNLLAQHSLGGISPAGFAALMWAPSLRPSWCHWCSLALSFAAIFASAIHGSRSGGSGRIGTVGEERRMRRRTVSSLAPPPSCSCCCCRLWCPGRRFGSPPWLPPLYL
jgi:Na+/H+ antiporter NhaD/arsenite permease-like protein